MITECLRTREDQHIAVRICVYLKARTKRLDQLVIGRHVVFSEGAGSTCPKSGPVQSFGIEPFAHHTIERMHAVFILWGQAPTGRLYCRPVFQQPGVRALELGEVERHVHGEVSSKQVVYFIRLIQPKASGAAVMKVAR